MTEEEPKPCSILAASWLSDPLEAERFFMNHLFAKCMALGVTVLAEDVVKEWEDASKERDLTVVRLTDLKETHDVLASIVEIESRVPHHFAWLYYPNAPGELRRLGENWTGSLVPNVGLRLFVDLLARGTKGFGWAQRFSVFRCEVVKLAEDGRHIVDEEGLDVLFNLGVRAEKDGAPMMQEGPIFLMPPGFHLLDLSEFTPGAEVKLMASPPLLAQWTPASTEEARWGKELGWQPFMTVWSDLLNLLDKVGGLVVPAGPQPS